MNSFGTEMRAESECTQERCVISTRRTQRGLAPLCHLGLGCLVKYLANSVNVIANGRAFLFVIVEQVN